MIQGIKLPKTSCYLGQQKLKKADIQMEFDQEMIEEYKKCRDDIVYFCKNYIKIVHVDRGLIPFGMWDFQADLVNHLNDNRFSSVLCSRQVGKSITTVAYILHFILFNDYKRVGIIANKGASARKVLAKLKLAFENLPHWLQQGVVEWNKGSIELDNGCIVEASSTSGDAARGDSLSLLFIDEAAFIDSNLWEEFYNSTYPTVSSGLETKIIMVSTANGMNHYYKIIEDARKGRSDYAYFEVKWDAVPTRTEEWKRETIANTSEEQFSQEHENTFLGGSKTLISNTALMSISYDDPAIQLENNKLFVFEKPIKNHVYVLSADVAEGIGLDAQAFNVIDITEYPFKQVCSFRDNKTTYLKYPLLIEKYGKAYNNAYVLVESNDVGKEVLTTLNYELEYENIVTLKTNKEKYQLGIRTTKATKASGCSNLKDLIEKNQLIVRDFRTLQELSGFVESGHSYEADDGYTDDLVMSLVNFSYFTGRELFEDISNHNIGKKMFAGNVVDNEENMLPLPVITDGTEDFTNRYPY